MPTRQRAAHLGEPGYSRVPMPGDDEVDDLLLALRQRHARQRLAHSSAPPRTISAAGYMHYTARRRCRLRLWRRRKPAACSAFMSARSMMGMRGMRFLDLVFVVGVRLSIGWRLVRPTHEFVGTTDAAAKSRNTLRRADCCRQLADCFSGNRGGRFHTDAKTLTARRWASRQWICCVLDFKGRQRDVWGRFYTELFFLDEATALAAGHRPCFECRRKDAQDFRGGYGERHVNLRAPPRAAEMDDVLHARASRRPRQARASACDINAIARRRFRGAGGGRLRRPRRYAAALDAARLRHSQARPRRIAVLMSSRRRRPLRFCQPAIGRIGIRAPMADVHGCRGR